MWTFGARLAVTGSTRTVWLPSASAGVPARLTERPH